MMQPEVIELLDSSSEENEAEEKDVAVAVAASQQPKNKRKDPPVTANAKPNSNAAHVSSTSRTSTPSRSSPTQKKRRTQRITESKCNSEPRKSRRTSRSSPPKQRQRQRSLQESKCCQQDPLEPATAAAGATTTTTTVPTTQSQQQRPLTPGHVLRSERVGGMTMTTSSSSTTTPAPSSLCWVCSIPLASSVAAPGVVYAAVHHHPTLPGVPVCAVCATTKEEDATDCCTLCGTTQPEENLFFLCDTVGCDTAWCEPCILQCHGCHNDNDDKRDTTPAADDEGSHTPPSSSPLSRAQRRRQRRRRRHHHTLHIIHQQHQREQLSHDLRHSDTPWACPACQPPAYLIQTSSHTFRNVFQDQAPEDLINVLYDAEIEKRDCERELEGMDTATLATTETEDDDDEAAEQRSAWEAHHVRLADFVSRLQDELETQHGLELSRLYQHFGTHGDLQDPHNNTTHVAAAEAAIAALPRFEYTAPDPTIYRLGLAEQADAIEDLGDTSTTAATATKTLADRGWRSHAATAEPWEVAIATREDSEIAATVAFAEDEDQDLQVKEHQAEPQEVQRLVVRTTKRQKPTSLAATTSEDQTTTQSPSPPPERVAAQLLSPQPMLLGAAVDAVKSDGPPFTVHAALAKHLKSHQVNGIKFMWKNLFADFELYKNGDESKIGGCILAHAMGLGKSLSTICLIHTIMHHAATRNVIRNILLVVPVNTVQNWEHEFEKWLQDMEECDVIIRNLNDSVSGARCKQIDDWHRSGGILIVTPGMLRNDCKAAKPDFVVVDEAHTMLKSSSTATNKALMAIPTKRRLGSPFQNNLFEYFHFLRFVRPDDVELGTEKQFDHDFVQPITAGMLKNSSPHSVQNCLLQARKLNSIVRPYLDRVNASFLRTDLQEMHQIVLHVRQTPLQTKLYGLYKRMSKENPELKNFFKMYQNLRPIHNHPATLLNMNHPAESKWWKDVEDTKLGSTMRNVLHGNKIIILLHIIVKSIGTGDKVLIYANSLPTLDYVEEVLGYTNWGEHVPSLKAKFPDITLGGWRKNKDFLRIDGHIGARERGCSVDKFHTDDRVKLFLLSQAGGIGINLVSANRVVLIDSHFNPTVASQAVSRSYRYGQTKPVFCYHLLTQGSMEESIYSRSVNKTGLGFLVVDEKAIDRNFSAEQLNFSNLSWVQCDRCEKWRCLVSADGIPQEDTENLPDKWFCELNNDVENNSCKAPEQDQSWYMERVAKLAAASHDRPLLFADKAQKNEVPASEQLDDEVLHHILTLTSHKRKTKMISKNYIHDSLLNTTDSLTALEQIETKVKETEKETGAVDAAVGACSAQLPTEKKQPAGVPGDAALEFQLPTTMKSAPTSQKTLPATAAAGLASHADSKPRSTPASVPKTAAVENSIPAVAATQVISKEQAATTVTTKKTPKDKFLSAAAAAAKKRTALQITRGVSPDVSLPSVATKPEGPLTQRKGQPKEDEDDEVIDLCDSDDE